VQIADRLGRSLAACHPGAIQPTWMRKLVIDAMLAWRERHGRLSSP
jgi:hypothetical protein